MTHPARLRKRLAVALACAAMSFGVLDVASAAAGTYTVYSCQTPAGVPAASDGWSVPEWMDHGWAESDCAASKGNMTIHPEPPNREPGTVAFVPHGTLAALAFAAPRGTTIERMTIWRAAALRHDDREQDAGAWKAWIGPNTDFYSPSAVDKCSYYCTSRGDATTISSTKLIDANRVDIDPAEPVGGMYVVGGCHGPDYSGNNYGCGFDQHPTSSGSSYWANGGLNYGVQAAQTVITDTSVPAVAEVTGGLANTGPHAGSESLTYKATDEGSGLYHTLVQIRSGDDTTWKTIGKSAVDSNDGRCVELDYLTDTDREFGFSQPCKLDASTSVTLDTTELPDGTYRLQVLVEDAAGNTATVLEPRSFVVANAAATPACASCGPSSTTPAPQATAGASVVRFTSGSRRTIRVRYGARSFVTGRLVDSAGNGVPQAAVEASDGARRTVLTTNKRGQYRYRLRPGRSRTITFGHRAAGSGPFDDTAAVVVRVSGVIRIHARKKSVPHNGLLQLDGHLLGARKGAEIQIQAQDGRRWRTIDLLTTDRKGRVHYRYRFQRATGATFLFRMRMSDQPKVGLLAGASKPVRVRVR